MFYSQSVARKVNAAPGLAALENPPGYLVSQPAFSVEYFRYALQKKKKSPIWNQIPQNNLQILRRENKK